MTDDGGADRDDRASSAALDFTRKRTIHNTIASEKQSAKTSPPISPPRLAGDRAALAFTAVGAQSLVLEQLKLLSTKTGGAGDVKGGVAFIQGIVPPEEDSVFCGRGGGVGESLSKVEVTGVMEGG